MANHACRFFIQAFFIGLVVDIALGARKSSIGMMGTTESTLQSPLADVQSTCVALVEILGYPCEEHTVTTEDGYILSLQRIPNGRSGSSSGSNKTPVLLQHGLFMDGVTWLLNSPDESLGYILADNGYDVWIANTRGTVHSSGHTSFSANDSAYWDWSWDELVEFDLPANFAYVYQQTGNQTIHYVGHSLGTLIALASFSEDGLLSMLRSAALLSPIAYMDQVSSTLVRGSAKLHIAEDYYEAGFDEFDPESQGVADLLEPVCKLPGANCFDLMSSITGPNCCLNESRTQTFLEYEPQPSSTKNMIHLSQMIRTGTITKYNYNNDDENMSHYGQVNPPAYNMSNIPTDIALFLSYGGADELSDVNDVQHLLNVLSSHESDKLATQFQQNYAHADFVMAINAKQIVYDPLMAFFKLQ